MNKIDSKNKKKSAIELKMKLLRDGIKNKEENGANTDFSLHITLVDEPNKKVPVVEKAKGLEKFENAMEQAKSYNPDSIIVHTYRNKNDRKGTAWVFKLTDEEQEEEKPLGEQISEIVESQMAKAAEKLSGVGNDGLGAIQKYEHLGEILTLKSEKQLTELRHKQELADINRQLNDKHEAIMSNEETIARLEEENSQLSKDFETYKTDRMAGLTSSISQAGMSIIGNLASQYLPQLIGGEKTQGLAGSEGNHKATMVENDDPREMLIEQLRLIVAAFDQETFVNFHRLMEIISADSGIIGSILLHLEAKNEHKNEGGSE